jgi:hypothetical protein
MAKGTLKQRQIKTVKAEIRRTKRLARNAIPPIVDLRVVQKVRDSEAISYTLEFRREGSNTWQDLRVDLVEEEMATNG